jgi:transcriptional regulator with XRE-family HTH domain
MLGAKAQLRQAGVYTGINATRLVRPACRTPSSNVLGGSVEPVHNDGMDDVVQRAELAAFLRARREATDPVSVGLSGDGRRRTPGLRREEVAGLAGLSVTWYTWLEQSRDISVSRKIIDSLARVLTLSQTERAHLYTLAGLKAPSEDFNFEHVDPQLEYLIDALVPNPAAVITTWWDVLAYNASYSALLGNLDSVPPSDRNIMVLAFTHVLKEDLLENWALSADQLVGQLRSKLARSPDDPRGQSLLKELKATGEPFGGIWDSYVVKRFEASRVAFRLPGFERLEFDFIKLWTADDESQQLVTYTPVTEQTKSVLSKLAEVHQDRAGK